MRPRLVVTGSLALGTLAALAQAQAPSAPSPSASAPSPPPVVASVGEPCVEKLPADKPRPKLKETLPSRGLSGHARPADGA